MLNKKRQALLGLSILIVVIAATLFTTQIAYLAPFQAQEQGSSFRFTLQVEKNNNLHVVASYGRDGHPDDPAALQNHIKINKERALVLSKQTISSVPVQVTFAKPLPIDEARELVRKTGLKVDSFAMVGRSSLTSAKCTSIFIRSLEEEVQTEQFWPKPNRDGGIDENVTLTGVMVVKAQATNPAGLEELANDERVYLVDTSEYEIRQIIAQRHSAVAEGKDIVIAVPSPFFALDW